MTGEKEMLDRYRLYRRKNGIYYVEDKTTGKQSSLKTKDRGEAEQLLAANNQSESMPYMCRELAKVYIKGSNPNLLKYTWQDVLEDIYKGQHGSSLDRWQRFGKSKPLDSLRALKLFETRSEDILAVLRHPRAGSSCNNYLRRLHNYALDLGWLMAPVLHRRQWPAIKYKKARAITEFEHEVIIQAEQNPERRLFYEMLWETGGSQSDVANLSWANVDKEQGILSYYRMKLEGRGNGALAQMKIGKRIQRLLDQLPEVGLFFPSIAREQAKHRSAEFKRRCRLAGISGITLHSYRYAMAERLKKANVSEREAMGYLGHNSPAIHRAYAVNASIQPVEIVI
jgi:integrase